MMADGYRGNEHAISFDMSPYKLRLQTWWPANPLDTSHDRWRFPVGQSLVPFAGLIDDEIRSTVLQ